MNLAVRNRQFLSLLERLRNGRDNQTQTSEPNDPAVVKFDRPETFERYTVPIYWCCNCGVKNDAESKRCWYCEQPDMAANERGVEHRRRRVL